MIGGVAGGLLSLDITGIDFAMTALFIVIAVDQWKNYKEHLPVFLGFGITLAAVALLGPDAMLIPALCAIVLALLLVRGRLEPGEAAPEAAEKGGR